MRAHAIIVAALVAASAVVRTSDRHFYDDDPIARQPESRDASGAAPYSIQLFYEYTYNLFVTGRRAPADVPAGNLNTVDEIPNSSWFTNRIGTHAMSERELARGVNTDAKPAAERWVILREKTAGT